jgi:FkbM family methyltransferase
MSTSDILDRSLKFLSKIAPRYFERGQVVAMHANPTTFVREALWRIAHPGNSLINNHKHDTEDVMQFLAFAAPLVPQASSQFFQDLWALWECANKRGGYFVEFGATDGKFLSNSYFLEKGMGWDGIVAEPHPSFALALHANRSCYVSEKLVYSRTGEAVEFLAMDQSATYSRIAAPGERLVGEDRIVRVKTISLNDLLTEASAPTQIDFLSVDTEGSEFDILSHLDFKRWDVRCIAVEHNSTASRQKLFDLLTDRGFRRKWPEIGHVDDWYVRG